MSQRTLLTGNAAAAWGARLAEVDYVPAFPITPQTEIIELLAQWHRRKTEIYKEIVRSGKLPGRPGVARVVR